MKAEDLWSRHASVWAAAIHNPFLKALRDGSITKEQFDTWLKQDYAFVQDFIRLVAHALSQAPFQAFDVLLGGLTALQAELSWFQAKGQERGLQLHAATLLPSCQSFCQFMTDLRAGSTFSVQIAVIWAIEKAYNEVRPGLPKAVAAEMLPPCAEAHAGMPESAGAFLRLLQAWAQAAVQPAYQVFADRWGSPEFTAYCQALRKTVDACLSEVNSEEAEVVGTAVGKVAQQEVAFWNMAYEAETG